MTRFCAVALTFSLLGPPAATSAATLRPTYPLLDRATTPIQHVIVVVMENRTFDNMFHGFPGADTVNFGYTHTGQKAKLQPVTLDAFGDPSHSHTSLVTEYDNGKMDGFDLDSVTPVGAQPKGGAFPPTFPYAYVPLSDVYADDWRLALHYGIADRMFASQNAPSYPGHQYLIAGQAGRAIEDPTSLDVWGCDAPTGTTVALLAPDGKTEQTPGPFPCFDYQTLGDLLDQGGVSWRYYVGNIGTPDGGVSAYDAIKHIRYGNDWNVNVSSPETNFFSDLEFGNLPAVSWVNPPILASDHAGTLSELGPYWVGSVYTALANSKYYNNTVMFVTWDDSGGWYDHVPPPKYNGFGYGFRVPLIAISPYAKAHYVSHHVHDYGSILRYIEKNYGLGSLGQDDAQADDLSDMFNYGQKPVGTINVPWQPFSFWRKQWAYRLMDDDH